MSIDDFFSKLSTLNMRFSQWVVLLRRITVWIFSIGLFTGTVLRAETWQFGVQGIYSTAWSVLPFSESYSRINADNQFFDFAGRVAHRWGPGFVAFTLGLYSSFGLRDTSTVPNSYVAPFTMAASAALGSPVNFTSRDYRAALGWSAAQLRYRIYWYELFFIEAGLGGAYGFGALQSTMNGSSASGNVADTQYARYSEWGVISSLASGVAIPFGETLSIELSFEFAYLKARIRNPDINKTGDYLLSQPFYRSGIGVLFRFG